MRRIIRMMIIVCILLAGCASETALENELPSIHSDEIRPPETFTDYELFLSKEYWMNRQGSYDLDIDHDGKADIFEYATDHEECLVTLTLTLGNGTRISHSVDSFYFEYFDTGDLTGDGMDELVAICDTGGAGGAGCHILTIFHINENADLVLLHLPGRDGEDAGWNSGYDFYVEYHDGFLMDVTSEILVLRDVPVSEYRRESLIHFGIYDDKGIVRDSHEFTSDGLFEFSIISFAGSPALKAPQYIWENGHADGFGLGTNIFKWDKDGFVLAKQYFDQFE